MPSDDCSIDLCHYQARNRGWCIRHFANWRITGTPVPFTAPHTPTPWADPTHYNETALTQTDTPLNPVFAENLTRVKEWLDAGNSLDVPNLADLVTADGFALGGWVHTQRSRYTRGDLPPNAAAAVLALGIDLAPQARLAVADRIALLRTHHQIHARHPFPTETDGQNYPIGRWTQNLLTQWRNGDLHPEHIEALEGLGYFNGHALQHLQLISSARAYHHEHGHLDPPRRSHLGMIFQNMRTRDPEFYPRWLVTELNDLGMRWDSNWTPVTPGKSVQHAAAWISAHGTGYIPKSATINGWDRLGSWALNQRSKYRRGALAESRVQVLRKIGFAFEPTPEALAYKGLRTVGPEKIAQFVAWRQKNKTGWVPVSAFSEHGEDLGGWATNVRTAYRQGILHPETEQALTETGFLWEKPSHRASRARGSRTSLTAPNELRPRYRANGSGVALCLRWMHQNQTGTVPTRAAIGDWTGLGQWARRVRDAHKQGTLAEEIFNPLNDAGFDWQGTPGRPTRTPEEARQACAEWITKNGTGWVPRDASLPGWHQFGDWARKQRQRRIQETLSQSQIAALDAIGFAWSPPTPQDG